MFGRVINIKCEIYKNWFLLLASCIKFGSNNCCEMLKYSTNCKVHHICGINLCWLQNSQAFGII